MEKISNGTHILLKCKRGSDDPERLNCSIVKELPEQGDETLVALPDEPVMTFEVNHEGENSDILQKAAKDVAFEDNQDTL